MIREIGRKATSGIPMILVLLLAQAATVWLIVRAVPTERPLPIIAAFLGAAIVFFLWFGLFMVAPNEGKVLQLFGDYKGTVRVPGLRWANPFYTKKGVSLRIRNFESGRLKVNELGGSPIEIASIVVWKVVDTAEAVFEVDDYVEFVRIQTESALRNLATSYPYDQFEDDVVSLRSHTNEIADRLKVEVQERLGKAGVEVIEARISHLAYAAEIAGAMLQRQQADAIIAARSKIVQGAVGMVEMAIAELARTGVIELDEERKAAMVSNLLVVLCSDEATQPVVNTGTLYH